MFRRNMLFGLLALPFAGLTGLTSRKPQGAGRLTPTERDIVEMLSKVSDLKPTLHKCSFSLCREGLHRSYIFYGRSDKVSLICTFHVPSDVPESDVRRDYINAAMGYVVIEHGALQTQPIPPAPTTHRHSMSVTP